MCPSELHPPEWFVAYPSESKPLLIQSRDPFQTAWLPENPDEDYNVSSGAKGMMVSSPALSYARYVLGLHFLPAVPTHTCPKDNQNNVP